MNPVIVVADGLVVARRNLVKIRRVPDLLVGAVVSPIMFVLLFAYVFGGAIEVPGVSYREFLIAGIFAQTVVFGATITGSALAEDLQKGVVDRFRSLPVHQASVLLGRIFADLVFNLVTVAVMSLTGLLVGWRVRTSPGEALLGVGLLLLLSFGLSWVMALVGLVVRAPEVVNNVSFVVVFPLTFVANTFVPADTLPGPLRAFAEWNPVSTATQACRELFGNLGTAPVPVPDVWSMRHPALYTVLCSLAIAAVFLPLAVHRYGRAAGR